MFLRLSITLVALSSMIFISGCQTVPYQGEARDVSVKPKNQGVVSIPLKHRDEDRAKATERMNRNCAPFPAEVVEEGEVAVGQETRSSGKETDRASSETKVGSLFGIPVMSGEAAGKNTSSTSTTTAIKEWHISYKCIRETASAKKGK